MTVLAQRIATQLRPYFKFETGQQRVLVHDNVNRRRRGQLQPKSLFGRILVILVRARVCSGAVAAFCFRRALVVAHISLVCAILSTLRKVVHTRDLAFCASAQVSDGLALRGAFGVLLAAADAVTSILSALTLAAVLDRMLGLFQQVAGDKRKENCHE